MGLVQTIAYSVGAGVISLSLIITGTGFLDAAGRTYTYRTEKEAEAVINDTHPRYSIYPGGMSKTSKVFKILQKPGRKLFYLVHED